MKPLTFHQLPSFIERFSHFKDAEFRALDIISPTQTTLTFALQDKARAYDWITITLEFSGIIDARFLENKQLAMIDMQEGATIIEDENLFAFGIGECYNISNIKSSSCFVVASTLKYQEGQF